MFDMAEKNKRYSVKREDDRLKKMIGDLRAGRIDRSEFIKGIEEYRYRIWEATRPRVGDEASRRYEHALLYEERRAKKK